MQKPLIVFMMVLCAGVLSCESLSSGSAPAPAAASADNGDIAAQPVHYPFSDEDAPEAEKPQAPKPPPIVVKPTQPVTPEPTTAVATAEPEPTPEPTAPKELTPTEKAAAELEAAVNGSVVREKRRKQRVLADVARRLDLREAIDLALERNLKLKQQSEAIAEAEARLREKQNDYGPRLQFDFLAYTWQGVFADTKVADPDIPAEGTGRAQITLFTPVWFARRQREAAVRQAMEEIKVRKKDYELKRSEVIVEVIKRYFGVLEADEALTHAEDIVEHNRKRLDTLKVLRDKGKILKNRVLLGEKFSASATEEVEYRRAERQLSDSRFRKVLNLPDAEPIELHKPAVLSFPEIPSFHDARMRMRTDNPALQRLLHERMSAYWTGRVRHWEEPRAEIAVRYGLSFPKYREITDDFLTIGLSVNWPIAKVRLDRAKRDQARHRVRQLELEEDIINDELDLSTQETYAAYLKSLRRLTAKDLDVSLAEENLRLSRVFRKHGTAEGQEPEDVFQVQVNAIALAESRMDRVKVKYETMGLLADLYQRMGAMDELVRFLSSRTEPFEPPAPVKASAGR